MVSKIFVKLRFIYIIYNKLCFWIQFIKKQHNCHQIEIFLSYNASFRKKLFDEEFRINKIIVKYLFKPIYSSDGHRAHEYD